MSGLSRRTTFRIIPAAVLGVVAATLLPAPAAAAAPGQSCDERNNNTYSKLLECVTVEGVREHQQQFQKIADDNDDPFYPNGLALRRSVACRG